MDTATRVETLLRRISVLVAERQALWGDPERRADLELNRLDIAQNQRELNRALIELYGKKAA
jgi:lipase chaperone LimK